MESQPIEMEKVTIELPKSVMEFLRRAETEPQKYLEYSLIQIIMADVDVYSGEWPPATQTKPILQAA